jgi:2'-5' RNA ligase
MVEPSGATESAMVMLVPEAEAAVERWRQELEPSAALGVPAHVTLLYPFADPEDISERVIAKIAETVGGFGAFDFELDEVRWFDETVVWLGPHPVEPFVVRLANRSPDSCVDRE